MKKMFLASSFVDVASLLADFEPDLSGKRITFIPTASKVEKYVVYVEEGRAALEQMGLVIDELDVSAAAPADIAAKIRMNDYIYVSGGNTFYLLQELKRTGAAGIIADAVNAGKLYIGESAGSIIASADIEYVQGMDSIEPAPDLPDFAGLSLVDFYTVPHYTCFPFIESAQQIVDTYSATLSLRPITNSEVICVKGDKISVKSI